jgi:hypothetical protein
LLRAGLAGADVRGGSSGDTNVYDQEGDPLIDCGSAFDTVVANGATTILRCEQPGKP